MGRTGEGIKGNLPASYGGQSNADYNVYFGGKLIWAEASAGLAAGPVGTDRLGSVAWRNGTANRYFPYGQEATATGQDRTKFATYYRDETTSFDYARNRYYSTFIARFTTPDPYRASGGPADPQSWNRYSYTRGDPVNRADPSGLLGCSPDFGGACFSVTVTGYADLTGAGVGPANDYTGQQIAAMWRRLFPSDDTNAENLYKLGPQDRPGGGGRSPSPRQLMLARRDRYHEAIYGTGDTVFGPEILDCMAGRESDWNPYADNGQGYRGMFQMGESAWADVYHHVSGAPDYMENVFDPASSAAAAASYLNILLGRVVGRDKYGGGEYGDSDLISAIRRYNGSLIAESYASQIWECSRKLKAGDLEGALKAIGKP